MLDGMSIQRILQNLNSARLDRPSTLNYGSFPDFDANAAYTSNTLSSGSFPDFNANAAVQDTAVSLRVRTIASYAEPRTGTEFLRRVRESLTDLKAIVAENNSAVSDKTKQALEKLDQVATLLGEEISENQNDQQRAQDQAGAGRGPGGPVGSPNPGSGPNPPFQPPMYAKKDPEPPQAEKDAEPSNHWGDQLRQIVVGLVDQLVNLGKRVASEIRSAAAQAGSGIKAVSDKFREAAGPLAKEAIATVWTAFWETTKRVISSLVEKGVEHMAQWLFS